MAHTDMEILERVERLDVTDGPHILAVSAYEEGYAPDRLRLTHSPDDNVLQGVLRGVRRYRHARNGTPLPADDVHVAIGAVFDDLHMREVVASPDEPADMPDRRALASIGRLLSHEIPELLRGDGDYWLLYRYEARQYFSRGVATAAELRGPQWLEFAFDMIGKPEFGYNSDTRVGTGSFDPELYAKAVIDLGSDLFTVLAEDERERRPVTAQHYNYVIDRVDELIGPYANSDQLRRFKTTAFRRAGRDSDAQELIGLLSSQMDSLELMTPFDSWADHSALPLIKQRIMMLSHAGHVGAIEQLLRLDSLVPAEYKRDAFGDPELPGVSATEDAIRAVIEATRSGSVELSAEQQAELVRHTHRFIALGHDPGSHVEVASSKLALEIYDITGELSDLQMSIDHARWYNPRLYRETALRWLQGESGIDGIFDTLDAAVDAMQVYIDERNRNELSIDPVELADLAEHTAQLYVDTAAYMVYAWLDPEHDEDVFVSMSLDPEDELGRLKRYFEVIMEAGRDDQAHLSELYDIALEPWLVSPLGEVKRILGIAGSFDFEFGVHNTELSELTDKRDLSRYWYPGKEYQVLAPLVKEAPDAS